MKIKVLIVDDNGDNLYLLKTILEGQGWEVHEAANGKVALDIAKDQAPDLIVSDILMPVMDGYTLCRQCKSDEKLKNIPFVFYTATYTEPKDEKFAQDVGADRFIIKPEKPANLIKILIDVLGEKKRVKPGTAKPLGEEMEFFRRHNEILFSKLEKKMSDLEAANQELKRVEEQYRLSFENITDVIFMIDAGFNILSMSPSMEKVLGYKPQDFIGRSVADLGSILTPQSQEQAINHASRILQGETIPPSIYEFIAKDGTIKIGEVSGTPIMRDGNVSGIVAVARDITERRKAEDALRESEKKYRLLADKIPDIVFILSMDLKTTYVSPSVQTLLGFTQEERMLQTVDQQLTPDSLSVVFDALAKELALEKEGHSDPQRKITLELEYYHKDGSTRWTETIISGIRDEQGALIAVHGVNRDITDHKKAREELQQTLDRLSKAMGATIRVLAAAVEARDPYTAGHQMRAANLACAIAEEMGLPREKIDGILMAGSIHDIGKLSVPAEILTKSSKLKNIEFALIKEHAQKGHEMLKDVESPWPLSEIVYQHHERMDGSGYPRNLKGDEILMEARILAVADVVEAMASHRPYRPARGVEAALEEIEKNRGILYDDAVADACLKLFRKKSYRLPEMSA